MALKVAVIGLGRMGAEPSSRFENKIPEGWLPLSHAESILSTKGLDLVGLCDRDEERLNRFSEYYKVDLIYTDYKELIDQVRPDILSIATRTDVRCEIIEYALSKGVKGFYAEKPISRSIKECKRILEKIELNNAKIVYGATRRAMDSYKKAKEIIQSGKLGEIIEINVEFGKCKLLWSLPHATDIILYFADSTEIDLIQGHCDIETVDKVNNLIDCDPVVRRANFLFKNGISANISQIMGGNVRIGCSNGNLIIHGDGHHIEINRRKGMMDYFLGTETIPFVANRSGTQHLMSDLSNAVINNVPVYNIKPIEILRGQEMLFGIVESSMRNGIWINHNNVNEELVITGRTENYIA